MTINDLIANNPRRVQIYSEFSENLIEELEENLLIRDYGSISGFKRSYYYRKYKSFPLRAVCVKGLQTNAIEVNEFGKDVTLYPGQVKADCPIENNSWEFKYTRLRKPNTQSQRVIKVVYLWEDTETKVWNFDEAADYLIQYLDVQIEKLKTQHP